jgi:three-Cys-motif partner protein
MAKITRIVNKWTFKKLDILDEYLTAYVKATKRAAESHGIYYIDLFSGCGKVQLKSTGEVRNGSPLIALEMRPSFYKYFFIEENRNNHDSLIEYLGEYPQFKYGQVRTYLGDCNHEIDRVLSEIPQSNPIFAFLDPESPNLYWATIKKLASHKKPPNNKIELFVLFPYNMGIARLLLSDPTIFYNKGYDKIIERLMPYNSSWKDHYMAKVSGKIDRHELRRKFVSEYENGFRQLGYEYVLRGNLLTSDVNRPLYFLCFATDHLLGYQIMLSRFQKARPNEQLSYLSYNERY